jgi:hypothetical protein
VPLPGCGGQACDDNKGINGLSQPNLLILYNAVESKTSPLGLRRIDVTEPTTPGGHDSMAVGSGTSESVDEDVTDGSAHGLHIRRRDDEDENDLGQPARKRRSTMSSVSWNVVAHRPTD